VGLLWAARLISAGAEVVLLDHRPEWAAFMGENGIFLEDPQGNLQLAAQATADQAQALAQCQLALVCVKAYQTAQVAAALREHLPATARALTLQNGAGNVEALVEALGPGRVLGGITSEGATLLGPGQVRHAGQGQTHLGPAEGEADEFCGQVAGVFNLAGFKTETASGVANLIWTKLIINVGINALTAILGVKNGQLLEREASQELMAAAVEEAVAVGAARGIRFLHDDMLERVRQVAQATAGNVSSMLQDVRAKRRTEVDYINGYVARQAQGLGLATPVNLTLTRLVRAMEQGQA
jgi:2-dehydropantoate 2-reductase